MLTRAHLVNLTIFMDRVAVTGKEAIAWVETLNAVAAEINAIDEAARKELPPLPVRVERQFTDEAARKELPPLPVPSTR